MPWGCRYHAFPSEQASQPEVPCPILQMGLSVLDDLHDRKAVLHYFLSVNAYVPSFANYCSILSVFEMDLVHWLYSCVAGCDVEILYFVVLDANIDLLYALIFALKFERANNLELSFDYHPIPQFRRAPVFFFWYNGENHLFLSFCGVCCKVDLEKHQHAPILPFFRSIVNRTPHVMENMYHVDSTSDFSSFQLFDKKQVLDVVSWSSAVAVFGKEILKDELSFVVI